MSIIQKVRRNVALLRGLLSSGKISWEKLTAEDRILLSNIHKTLREEVGPTIFRVRNPLYRIAMDDAIGVMYGLSNPDKTRRDTTYIREKLASVEYRLKAMEKESMIK